MNDNNLDKIAVTLSKPPKGILAADESTNTITKRFDSINLDSSFENRRKYRELLFKTHDLNKFISGVILFDETIRQSTSEGIPFSEFLKNLGILVGIKVDTGALPLTFNSHEKITEGLDGLAKRIEEYKKLGAVFTKWRAIIDIDDKNSIPSDYAIDLNCFNLARYAKVVQDHGLVPIVEPEVLMDGNHNIQKCYNITSKTLKSLFNHLKFHDVDLKGILLKPNMVIAGKKCSEQASVEEVALQTVKCLKENVPDQVPGIVFLSGGQSNELATQHLNQMNISSETFSWNLSFSYGRALQQPALTSWQGKSENMKTSQDALYKRSNLNSSATLGKYSIDLENI